MQTSDFASVRALMADPGPDIEALLTQVDPEKDATVVVAGGKVVAWGIMRDGHERFAGVDPSMSGKGIGTWLLKWSAWRAKAAGSQTVVQHTTDPKTAQWLLDHGPDAVGGDYVMGV